ncbi:MAG: hypothetical protein OQL20_12710 [Sedimenticola sp.]|nr:hypothetical protein [Sedimenticola sp.]
MPTEWVDIVDTAVKIGLGGLVSGIATYHVTKLKNRSDDAAARKEVIRSLLLEAVKHADEYFDFVYDYYSKLESVSRNSQSIELSDKDWDDLYEYLDEHSEFCQNNKSSFSLAESRLQLLGLKDPCDYLSKFQRGEAELMMFVIKRDKTLPDEQFLVEWAEKYVPIKTSFQKATSDAFFKNC